MRMAFPWKSVLVEEVPIWAYKHSDIWSVCSDCVSGRDQNQ